MSKIDKMFLKQVENKLAQSKPELWKKYPLQSLGIFGSYVRNEQTEESDIDFIVEFSQPVGFEIIDLVMDLEKILGKKVDILTKDSLKPKFWSRIENSIVYV